MTGDKEALGSHKPSPTGEAEEPQCVACRSRVENNAGKLGVLLLLDKLNDLEKERATGESRATGVVEP